MNLDDLIEIKNIYEGVKRKSKIDMEEFFIYGYSVNQIGGYSILRSGSMDTKNTRKVILFAYLENLNFD